MTAALTNEDATKFVADNYKGTSWATGCISRQDARFLYEMIVRERPKRMMEIGVASGVSTAFISRVLTAVDPDAMLHSFDALDYFYADKTKPCGAFLEESFGKRPANVDLTVGVSSSDIAKRLAGQADFDFVFIDANHNHPWPCLDMLSIIQITKPGAWVAHHDINLPYLHDGKFRTYGPNYLFNGWPGEKIEAATGTIVEGRGMVPNIGAIKLFPNKKESLKAVMQCMRAEWQQDVAIRDITMAAENIAMADKSLVREFFATVGAGYR